MSDLSRRAGHPELWNGDRPTNDLILAGCPGPHQFWRVAAADPETGAPSRYQCALCHGVVSGPSKYWYVAGLRAGRREVYREHTAREARARMAAAAPR